MWLNRATGGLDAPSSDSPAAIVLPPAKTLERARTELVADPASAYRWADLAEAEINANNLNGGQFCAQQALRSAPGNPAILFRVANLYLRLEDYPNALQNTLAVLRNPDLADYYERVFALYSTMDMPLDSLLNQGVPRTPQAANAFLRFWVDQNRLEEAETTWRWISQNSLRSVQSAGSYVTLLAKNERWDDALQSWRDYTARLDQTYNRTNWVYNSGFEMKPVNCPFDWRLVSQDSSEVERDTEQAYRGGASLRLRFYGTPKRTESQAYQTVLLTPGKWIIKGVMKTQQLTGDQGVVIRVVDAADPTRLDVATNTFESTEDWTPVSTTFEVGTTTRLARVEILRPPGRDMDVHVAGNVWIDAVHLAPAL